jgi:transposase
LTPATAQIFVAAMGASNYTYACATATQTAADWVGSLIGALEFIGGVPRLIVPTSRAPSSHSPIATSPAWAGC